MDRKGRKLRLTWEIGAIFGVDPSTVRRWAYGGCPHVKRGRELLFDSARVLEWRLARAKESGGARGAETRLLRARAEKTEEQVRRLRAELLPVAEVSRVWDAMLAEMRRRSLAMVPKLARATSAAPATVPGQVAVLGDGVRDLLNDLARLDPAEVEAAQPGTTAVH